MDYREWFLSLSEAQRDAYAQRAGTTAGYIRVHLIGRRKIPRPALLNKLADASDGKWTVAKLLAFFYKSEQRVDPVVNQGAQQASGEPGTRGQLS